MRLSVPSTDSFSWQISFTLFSFSPFQIVAAIQKILYATDDSPSLAAEAHALISQPQSPGTGKENAAPRVETQKRKSILNAEVNEVALSALSPRQRLSDFSDVHQNISTFKC